MAACESCILNLRRSISKFLMIRLQLCTCLLFINFYFICCLLPFFVPAVVVAMFGRIVDEDGEIVDSAGFRNERK